jgi:TolB-like protein
LDFEGPKDLVTREELKKRLWPSDTFIDFDQGLNKAVNRLREMLGDSAENPRFIETLPRKGYRFIAPIEPVADQTASSESQGTVLNSKSAPPRMAPVSLLAGILGLVTVVTIGSLLIWRMTWLGRAEHPIRSIAVLPLENLSGDPAQDYFADGMTDELITNLGQVGSLRVISRTSIMRYKGARNSLSEIARELNVDAIIEGTVRRSGEQVRITAQLVRATSDKQLWSQAYQRDLRDVLVLQADIARAVVKQVQATLSLPEPLPARMQGQVNPAAYESYWKGEYFLDKTTPESLQTAGNYFRDAIAADPAFVPAYHELAASYIMLWYSGALSKNESQAKASLALNRALVLDPLCGPAHAGKGWAAFSYDFDFITAGSEFKRAAELSPNAVQSHLGLADCRVGGGALARWPPSAAQTARTVFPYAAFTMRRCYEMQATVLTE